MSDDTNNKMLNYYEQLLTIHSDLQAELEELTEEEKELHQDILTAIDKSKIEKMQEHIKNIKE